MAKLSLFIQRTLMEFYDFQPVLETYRREFAQSLENDYGLYSGKSLTLRAARLWNGSLLFALQTPVRNSLLDLQTHAECNQT